jgi:hypothetical protein
MCSEACHPPFPPKKLPLTTTTSANHRRHSRLAHTSATLIIILLHPPTTLRAYQPRPSSGSSRPPCYPRFRVIIIIVIINRLTSLSCPVLSVSLEKREEEEEGYSESNVMHACICICFVCCSARSISACLLFVWAFLFNCHFLFSQSMAHGPFVGRAEGKNEERPLFGRRKNLYSFTHPLFCLLEEEKKKKQIFSTRDYSALLEENLV